MTRKLQTLSMALMLALGSGAPATNLHGDETAASISAGHLYYIHLSEAESGWFDSPRGSVPRGMAKASHTATSARMENAPVYNPPRRGAPATRIGGGSRGENGTDEGASNEEFVAVVFGAIPGTRKTYARARMIVEVLANHIEAGGSLVGSWPNATPTDSRQATIR